MKNVDTKEELRCTTRTTASLLKLAFFAVAVTTVLTACSLNRVVVHPIEGTDIVTMKKGESLTAPKDGLFVSDFYVEEIMKARVKDVR